VRHPGFPTSVQSEATPRNTASVILQEHPSCDILLSGILPALQTIPLPCFLPIGERMALAVVWSWV
jgi:hypothetical protein